MTRTFVSELMTPNPITIAHNQTVGKAMELTARHTDDPQFLLTWNCLSVIFCPGGSYDEFNKSIYI